ncbi:kinase-like domain-containing protein [Tanacetum coccineum]
MSDNNFRGKLTIDFSKLRDINIIILHHNNFHGRGEADDMRFIDSLSNCTRLKDVVLVDCNFIGVLPISIGNLSDQLSFLALGYNQLFRNLPSSIGSLVGLTALYLGSILDAIRNLSLLTELYLDYNKLEGHIPSSLGNCTRLIALNLAGNKKRNSQPPQSLGNEGFLKVSYNELLKATDGFSTKNLIGEGGFSSVYKGILDSDDDRFVAVKVYIFHNEDSQNVDFHGNDFKALVYEFMPNGSVHNWLHSSAKTSKLNFLQRINILRDVAIALDYLHNRCQTTIVHGDLKPSNILLDDDMVAHVGDFGLARLLGTDLNQNSSTGLKGTIGYAPPEYGIASETTSFGDVYSFGILLLEIITGKKPTDDMFNDGLSLHKFAYMALPDHVVDVIDGDASVLQCTEDNAKKMEECLVCNDQGLSNRALDNYIKDPDPITLISKLDISDLLHLYPNDSTALTVVSKKLKGTKNYQVWSCAMLLALEGKNKTGFIDGSCKISNTDDVLGRQWDRVNAIVLGWILNSISEELYLDQIFSKRAKHVWE